MIKSPLELDAGLLKRRHRFDVTRKRRLHIDQSAAVDAVIIDNGFLRTIEMVHMRVEHQRRAPAGSFQRADDVRPAVFDVLILDLHAELLELAAEISCHALFLAGDADDIGQVAGQFDDSIAIHLI